MLFLPFAVWGKTPRCIPYRVIIAYEFRQTSCWTGFMFFSVFMLDLHLHTCPYTLRRYVFPPLRSRNASISMTFVYIIVSYEICKSTSYDWPNRPSLRFTDVRLLTFQRFALRFSFSPSFHRHRCLVARRLANVRWYALTPNGEKNRLSYRSIFAHKLI